MLKEQKSDMEHLLQLWNNNWEDGNKGALDSITSLNLSGIINSMCGIGEENETTLSSSSIVESSTNLKVASTAWRQG